MVVATAARAGDWEITPGISVGGIYTSNVELTPTDERDDLVTVITPGVTVTGEGNRLLIDATYRAQGLIYADNSSYNDIFHQLVANGTAELVEDVLFIDGSANRRRINIDNTGPIAIDNINVTDNQSEVWDYGIGPRAAFRLGDTANLNLDWRWNAVRFEEGDASDSDNKRTLVSLESGEAFAKTRWRLFYNYRDASFDEGEDSNYTTYRANLAYQLQQGWSLLGTGGYEDLDTESESSDDTSGTLWGLGFGWAPNERVSVVATYGDRFFGSDWFLQARYRSRRTEIRAGYSRRPSLAQEFIADPTSVAPGAAPPSLGAIPTDTPTQSNEVFIRERGDADLTFTLRRGSIGIAGYAENRDYEIGDDEQVYGARGSAQWRLSRVTTADFLGTWQHTDFRAGGATDLWSILFGITRSLGRRVEARVELRYRKNDSDLALDRYDEARVGAGVRMTF